MTKSRPNRFRSSLMPVPVPVKATARTGISATDVRCPDCNAQPGEKCTNPYDGAELPPRATHYVRRRLATRAANLAQRDTAVFSVLDRVTPDRRLQIRRARGLSRRQAGEIFGLSDDRFRAVETGNRNVHDDQTAAYAAWLRVWDALIPTDDNQEEQTYE